MPRIILDCDVGIDDALAILWLADLPGVEIAALGSVHGNAHAAVAAANAQHVFDLVGLGHVPVAVGAAAPLAQPVSISGHVHGDDGLGGYGPAAAPRPFVAETAAEQIVRLARSEPGAYTILATGPLTNLALALHLEPDLPRLVERVVVMGGAVTVAGNITAAAEANIFHDPEAAEAVFAAAWPVVLVGLDVTMTAWLGEAELARIEADGRPRGRFAHAILQHYTDFYHSRHGKRGCALHDPAAAMLLVDPGLADYADWPIRVELSGDLTRGMTLADRRGYPEEQGAMGRPAVKVATRIDSERLVAGFLDGLLR
jgi:purine nucleosidase